MTAAERRTDGALAGVGLLDRERIIARPGFNRWLVPPAALAIHLCIGMAYGFSVFWLPLSKSLGITAPTAPNAVANTLRLHSNFILIPPPFQHRYTVQTRTVFSIH